MDSELEHDDRRVEGKGAGGWDFVENYTVAVQVAGHKNMYADRGSLLCYIMYYSSTMNFIIPKIAKVVMLVGLYTILSEYLNCFPLCPQ